MFARIIPVRDGKVVIDGEEYTLKEAVERGLVDGVGVDDDGKQYVIIKH